MKADAATTTTTAGSVEPTTSRRTSCGRTSKTRPRTSRWKAHGNAAPRKNAAGMSAPRAAPQPSRTSGAPAKRMAKTPAALRSSGRSCAGGSSGRTSPSRKNPAGPTISAATRPRGSTAAVRSAPARRSATAATAAASGGATPPTPRAAPPPPPSPSPRPSTRAGVAERDHEPRGGHGRGEREPELSVEADGRERSEDERGGDRPSVGRPGPLPQALGRSTPLQPEPEREEDGEQHDLEQHARSLAPQARLAARGAGPRQPSSLTRASRCS